MLKRFTPILALTSICWLVLAANTLIWGGQLNSHGIRPRHLDGVSGVLWAPFLHANYQHLAANTIPLLVLGAIICARSKAEFVIVTTAGILLGGGFTWLIARSAVHVGASGLIFCYFGYLASLAVFDRKLLNFVLSVLCVSAYGGMLRGIIPTSGPISWEGHATGFVVGIVVAWVIAKVKQTPLESREESRANFPVN